MITLEQLITHCLANNESPKQFRILYNQLIHRQHIEPVELFQNLNAKSGLQYYYIFEIFNYELGLSKIFEILVNKSVSIQLNFIKLLSQDDCKLIKDAEFDANFNTIFLKKLLSSQQQQQRRQQQQDDSGDGDDGESQLRDLIIDLGIFISSHNIHVYQEVVNQMMELSSSLQLPFVSRQISNSIQSSSVNNKNTNVYKFIKMKKFIWLNFQVLNYQIQQDKIDEFINTFTKIINNSSLNYVLAELLSSCFECMNVAHLGKDLLMINNWEFFIVDKLPLILQSNLKLNLEIFELILEKSLPTLLKYEVKLKFLKSLISLKLIKLERFYHLISSGGGVSNNNNNDIEINELLKFQNESIKEYVKYQEFNHIQNIINKNLIESNPEFTNIDDDNKLYVFCKNFNSTTFNLQLKLEFSKIITTTIVKLCDEKDSTRLRRLLFCLSSNLSTLDNFIFQTDPNLVLQKLVEICCNSDYLNATNPSSSSANAAAVRARRSTMAPEDVSMFGDDDDDEYDDDIDDNIDQEQNHQELYTDFSCILMHILFIKNRYRLQISKDNLFMLNLLQNFAKSSSLSSTTNIGGENINLSILKEWYNSIYNDNESLISDALIAKTTLVNSLQLIPIIFNGSIISYEDGDIGLELLMNGFEFFMQPFLIINLISIFYKLDNFLWLDPSNELVWKICNNILSLKLDGESKLMFNLIWNHINDDIQHWKSLSHHLTSTTTTTTNGNETNQDYNRVIERLSPELSTPTREAHHKEFNNHLNGLINGNFQNLNLSIYRDNTMLHDNNNNNHQYREIITKLIDELAMMLNNVIDNINIDQKNSQFFNHLEISSFMLLIFIKFDKGYLPRLNCLINGDSMSSSNDNTNDKDDDGLLEIIEFLLNFFKNNGNQLNHTILLKLCEKTYQHLSNL